MRWVLLAVGIALLLAGVLLFMAPQLDPNTWHEPHPAWAFALVAAGAGVSLVGAIRLGRRKRSEPLTFLTDDEESRVLQAIANFEARTSGELRVHLEHGVRDDILVAAKRTFETLGLTATRERNAVLFFVAVHDHRFAVLGDSGIDAKVPKGFWDDVVARVRQRFLEKKFGEGLTEGIEMAGTALATHFPPRPDDLNELPDSISRSPS